MSGAGLALSGVLPQGWAWLKPVLDAISKMATSLALAGRAGSQSGRIKRFTEFVLLNLSIDTLRRRHLLHRNLSVEIFTPLTDALGKLFRIDDRAVHAVRAHHAEREIGADDGAESVLSVQLTAPQ